MREKLIRFMTGRNGADNLSRAVSFISIALLVIGLFTDVEVSRVLWVFAVLGVGYVYFRIFSRNVYKRQAENRKYLNMTAGARAYFRGLKERWSQRKDYKFFRCPSCRTLLRVPRGKGKIKLVCRKCGTSFIRKT
jgi:LSD1 subclass zinc finger protein